MASLPTLRYPILVDAWSFPHKNTHLQTRVKSIAACHSNCTQCALLPALCAVYAPLSTRRTRLQLSAANCHTCVLLFALHRVVVFACCIMCYNVSCILLHVTAVLPPPSPHGCTFRCAFSCRHISLFFCLSVCVCVFVYVGALPLSACVFPFAATSNFPCKFEFD